MLNNFNVTTTVEVQSSVVGLNNTIIPLLDAGIITVSGSLTGPVNRELQLTADAVSSLGYKFKEWVVEVFPLELVEVATSEPYFTIESICSVGIGEGVNNTQVSTAYYTDGQFFYEDRDGDRIAPSGYYGAGSSNYYAHSTSTGITGPFVCGQTGTTGGGGNNPAQPGDELDTTFGGRPGGNTPPESTE
jgi:hypothetical protein